MWWCLVVHHFFPSESGKIEDRVAMEARAMNVDCISFEIVINKNL